MLVSLKVCQGLAWTTAVVNGIALILATFVVGLDSADFAGNAVTPFLSHWTILAFSVYLGLLLTLIPATSRFFGRLLPHFIILVLLFGLAQVGYTLKAAGRGETDEAEWGLFTIIAAICSFSGGVLASATAVFVFSQLKH